METQWSHFGNTVEIHWEYSGNASTVLWIHHEVTIGLLWVYSGSTVGMLWEHCEHAAVILYRGRSGTKWNARHDKRCSTVINQLSSL